MSDNLVARLREAAAADRIKELEAALKPFADEADEYEGLGVQDKDQIFVPLAACRQARKVLGEKNTPDWDDIRGCAPEATGNLISEDFVRKLRDQDWR